MSRSQQTLAPVETHPSFWTRVIALFARLWRVIWSIWTTVIVGGFLVGVILISFLIKGTTGLTDPRTWVVIQPLLAHPLLSIIGLIAVAILILCAFLAHRHQKKVARAEQHAYAESLVDIGRGVRKLLEDQNARPVASQPSTPKAVSANQEI